MARWPAKENQPEARGNSSRRWWIYVPVIGTSVWIFSKWFLGVTIPQEPVSFEELSIAINHQDSLMTKQWRKLWAKMPGLVTANISQLKPGPPAEFDRIHACRKLAQYGAKAVPILIEKLSDTEDRVIQEALTYLLEVGIGTDQTFEFLSVLVGDKNHTLNVRQVALLSLIGLHGEEERLIALLQKWAHSDNVALVSMQPKKVGLLNFPIGMSPWGFSYQITVRERLKPTFYELLLKSHDNNLILFAFYLFQRNNPHVMELGSAISETLSMPDPLVKEHALGILKEVNVDPNVFSPISPIKLKFLALLVKHPTRPIDQWLTGKLMKSTVDRFNRRPVSMLLMDNRQYTDLINDLNRIIRGDLIYDEQLFKDIQLRSETQHLLSLAPTGPDLRRLNKLLLEDAFPSALLPSNHLRKSAESAVKINQ